MVSVEIENKVVGVSLLPHSCAGVWKVHPYTSWVGGLAANTHMHHDGGNGADHDDENGAISEG